MRGILVPDRTEDFTADPVELFFDLAFVFGFSQLVAHLVEHPTWNGFGEASLLFSLLWLGWSQYTWSANAVSGNSRAVRAIFLVGTAVSVPMAASVSTAYGEGGPVFAISLAFIFLLAVAVIVQAYETGSPEWRSALSYSVPTSAFAVVLVVGAFFDGTTRIVIWLVSLTLFLYSTIRAGDGDWIVRAGHFSERHGLIVIIALGEVIVAIGIGVVRALRGDEGLGASTVASLFAAASFACILWWTYFDRPQPAFEHRAESLDGRPKARFARDVYTYSHLPIVGGVVVAAAALEEITLHPDDVLPAEFRLMLFGGLLLYFGGIALAVARAFRVIAKERIVGTILIGVVLLFGGDVRGWILLVLIDLILLGIVAAEHMRVERRSAD